MTANIRGRRAFRCVMRFRATVQNVLTFYRQYIPFILNERNGHAP